jgi:hypothetical protein
MPRNKAKDREQEVRAMRQDLETTVEIDARTRGKRRPQFYERKKSIVTCVNWNEAKILRFLEKVGFKPVPAVDFQLDLE